MTRPKKLEGFQEGRGYSKADWDEVSDNPEWTAEDFAKAKPFREVLPELAERMAREDTEAAASAGSEQAVAIERRIVERFKQHGDDWQKRINDVLRKAVGL